MEMAFEMSRSHTSAKQLPQGKWKTGAKLQMGLTFSSCVASYGGLHLLCACSVHFTPTAMAPGARPLVTSGVPQNKVVRP